MKIRCKLRILSLICLIVSLDCTAAGAKSGDPFNSATDVHWDEIDFQVEGICICPRPPPVFFETGIIVSYWEPFYWRIPFRSPTTRPCRARRWVPQQSMNSAVKTRARMQWKSPTNPPSPKVMHI